ncbi:MAG: hypothetical protein L6R42_003757 [Xanthoria sp. 1 TBL-2021]|nr:MAG: hypothetical protein L6R42_003757 [Xanthoria sp. 1 TBL-2021]
MAQVQNNEKPTSVDGLKKYLDANNIEYSHIEQIEGGTANYVFRVSHGNGLPRIYKHAEPYIASSNGAIPFPVDRMNYEATALQLVHDLLSDVNAVKVPKVWNYDQPSKVLVMTDAGDKTLKEAYNDPDIDIPEIGRLLGEWLVLLHHKTYEIGIGEGGNPIAKSIYRWSYSHLAQAAGQYGLDTDFCDYVDRTYGSLLESDDESVCHGDFWPGNIMLNKEKTLTVVDWEICRRGRPETDVAQFAAEAYLLDRFRGGKGLLDAFLKSYRRKEHDLGKDLTVDRRFITRFAVHMGVHLAFWPASVKWAEHGNTKAVIELGHELMRRGDAEDMGWLRENLLGGLLKRDD